MNDLTLLQERLGVRFSDVGLLRRALTHRSYVNEQPREGLQDNERLEFLGDAALSFIAGDWLYHHLPEMDEGSLTRLRAGLVRTETLADFARACGVGNYLLLGKGEEAGGGRDRDNNLCGAIEAIVGALYLDQALPAVRQMVEPSFGSALEAMLAEQSDKDAKSILQEWSQAALNETPVYRTVGASGPDHAKRFTVEVVIGGVTHGSGTGHSKQAAEQAAARDALARLRVGA